MTKKILYLILLMAFSNAFAQADKPQLKGDGLADLPTGNNRTGVIATINGDKTIVLGSLSKLQVTKIIASYMGQIQYCYEREARKDNSLQGAVGIYFKQESTSLNAKVVEETVKGKNIAACIAQVFGRMTLPADASNVEGSVTMSFRVEPSKEDKDFAKLGLTKDQMLDVINPMDDEIRNCLGKFNKDDRVKVSFEVLPSGNTSNIQTVTSTFKKRLVKKCIHKKIEQAVFPPPADNKIIKTNYTINGSRPKSVDITN